MEDRRRMKPWVDVYKRQAVDPASMNVGWYYNWDWKSFKDMNFSNKKFDDLEFVPVSYTHLDVYKRQNKK